MWLSSKEAACNAGDTGDPGSIPGLGRSPRGGHGNPLQYSLPGEFHGQRSLEGHSPQGRRVRHNQVTEPSEWVSSSRLAYLIIVLLCIYLMTSDIEHLFI